MFGTNAYNGGNTNGMGGYLDEIRIENVAHDANWITLCYQTEGNTGAGTAANTIVTNGPPIALVLGTGAPVLTSPTNNAINQQLSGLSLSWTSGGGAAVTSYEIQVATNAGFSSTVYDFAGVTATSQVLPTLSNSATYYWRVDATGPSGVGAWSGEWSFVTAIPIPGAPTPLSPTNGAPNVPVNVSLSWSTVSAASSYQVQIATGAGFGTTVYSQSGLTTTFISASGLANSTTYYWRAGAANAGGNGPWSAAWSFGTIYGTVGIPVLSSPASGASSMPLTVTLSWGTTSSASTFNVQVSTTSTFVPTVFSLNSLIGTSVTIGSLSSNTTYYWRVNGANAGGSGTWSAIWSFGTQTTSVPRGAGNVATTEFAVRGEVLAYSLNAAGLVEITFSDLLGRIALVLNQTQSTGHYAIEFKTCNLAAGRYIIHFKAAGIERRASVLLTR